MLKPLWLFQANPAAYKVTWLHNGLEVVQKPEKQMFISNQRHVLQTVMYADHALGICDERIVLQSSFYLTAVPMYCATSWLGQSPNLTQWVGAGEIFWWDILYYCFFFSSMRAMICSSMMFLSRTSFPWLHPRQIFQDSHMTLLERHILDRETLINDL